MNDAQMAMFGLPGGTEWVVIGLVALLLFGRRLPEVARSIGKSIVEFKRGIRDVEDDVDTQSRLDAPKPPKLDATPKSEAERNEVHSSKEP